MIDFPIWLAETERVPTLALPNETPADVLDLASHFGAKWLIVGKTDHGQWPAVLDGPDPTPPASRRCSCRSRRPGGRLAIRDVRVFRIACSGVAGASAPDSAAGPSE